MGKQDKPTDLIMDAFKEKTWNEIHTTDSWRVFKIISELVEGFEKLARIGPCVSIFGSARTHHNDKYYRLAEDIALKLTQKGYGVITGGGPGIMEAANKGARKGDGFVHSQISRHRDLSVQVFQSLQQVPILF